jgi:type II secretory pathway pseudopilin PulG
VIARRACRGSRVGCKSSKNAGGTPATTEERAVTIIEMLVVIMVIVILAALVLAASSYVQNKGVRARAETEIAAFSAALESYKADNGIYPRGNADLSTTAPYDTDNLDPKTQTDPTTSAYQKASLFLYKQLAGVTSATRSAAPSNKVYFSFKPTMLIPAPPSTADITGIRDPFGNNYGYSTAQAANPGGNTGYNPTYDLWSTAGTGTSGIPSPSPIQNKWIKNW